MCFLFKIIQPISIGFNKGFNLSIKSVMVKLHYKSIIYIIVKLFSNIIGTYSLMYSV